MESVRRKYVISAWIQLLAYPLIGLLFYVWLNYEGEMYARRAEWTLVLSVFIGLGSFQHMMQRGKIKELQKHLVEYEPALKISFWQRHLPEFFARSHSGARKADKVLLGLFAFYLVISLIFICIMTIP